jgi:hypothetical protein
LTGLFNGPRSFWTAWLSFIQSLNRRIVDARDDIIGVYSGLRTGHVVIGGHDLEQAVGHAHFKSDAAEDAPGLALASGADQAG